MKEWDIFLSQLDKEFGKQSVDKWLRSLKIVSFDARNLYLKANDNFQIIWFNEHIKPKVKSFTNANGRQIKIHFEYLKNEKKQPLSNGKTSDYFLFDKIDPFYHLSNFYFSEKDEITKKLISQLTGLDFDEMKQVKRKLLSSVFNPIFIYGCKKSGKTHLLTAIAKQFLDLSYNVIFVSIETFTKHVVSAIRGGFMPLFRKRYRLADVLILDNIQQLANRTATQEEFFHTFNTLHTLGKQIILSSNCPPHLLNGIEPRLISRFEWGISCCLNKPTNENLKQAIKLREKFLNIFLSDSQKNFLFQQFKAPEMLLKAFDIFVLRAGNKIEEINEFQMKDYLNDILNEEELSKINPEKIIKLTANYFGINEIDLIQKKQSKEFAYPRQIAIYLIRKDLNLAFTKIAKIFNRDHSTIMSAAKKIESLKRTQAKSVIEKIRNKY